MPIIVGTMTVWVTPCCSINVMAAPGSNSGMNTDDPPASGIPMIPPIDAAWNIGVWWRNTASGSRGTTIPMW